MNLPIALRLIEKARASLDKLGEMYEECTGNNNKPTSFKFSDELRAHCDAFKQQVEVFITKIFGDGSKSCQNYRFELMKIQFYYRSDIGFLHDRFAGGKAASLHLLNLMQDDVEVSEEAQILDTITARYAETILPDDLCLETRGYIERIAKQINVTYEKSAFDGCAMLMRRLLEILLILTYRYLDIEDVIKRGLDKYMSLDQIINNAKTNKKLSLSKDTRSVLDDFRKLGNFSAHKIEYNCRQSDISRIQQEYRVTVEELLYKSGLKM